MSCLPMSGKKPPHSNLIQILNVNTINEEARQLLKHIEHKNVLGSIVSQLLPPALQQSFASVLSGIHYLEHLNEQQIIYLEASTSYGERKQLLLPDGTLTNTKFLLTCPVSE